MTNSSIRTIDVRAFFKHHNHNKIDRVKVVPGLIVRMLHILRPLRVLRHGQRRWRVLSLLLLLLGSSPPAARRRRPILVVAAFQTTTIVAGAGAGRRRYLYKTTHRRLYEEDPQATENGTGAGADDTRHDEDTGRSMLAPRQTPAFCSRNRT